jgi:hypothetical protein
MSKSYRRRNTIGGQFAPRLIEMLESPAYRVLSRAGHQVLTRIEIELAHHGGMDNGKLPVTYTQFVDYGIHDHAVAPAIRELVALGFIEVTEQGRAGNAEWRRPSKYRLTYRHVDRANPTHEWRRISEADAATIVKEARRSDARSKPKRTTKKNRKPLAVSAVALPPETASENLVFHTAETASTRHTAEIASTIDTFGVAVGAAAGNLVSEEHAPASDQANGGCTDQANGGCSAMPDPWVDLDIPEMLRR